MTEGAEKPNARNAYGRMLADEPVTAPDIVAILDISGTTGKPRDDHKDIRMMGTAERKTIRKDYKKTADS
jgi:hypothetical protein